MDFTKRLTRWLPQAALAVLLIRALVTTNPYGFYIALRWITCPIFMYLASRAHNQNLERWRNSFLVLALVYNPLIRVHLSRLEWQAINLATLLVVGASAPSLSRTSRQS